MLTSVQHQTTIYSAHATQAKQLKHTVPGLILSSTHSQTGTILRTTRKLLRPLAVFLRNNSAVQATILVDIATTDKLDKTGRFSIKYSFLSVAFNRRLTVEIFTDETLTIPSLAAPFFNNQKIFASAGWLEREVWDLFGIYFNEHGDLRRILTDYGFTGNPLRKDFPLTGFHELVYNDTEGRVTVEPVELSQEFRVFHITF